MTVKVESYINGCPQFRKSEPIAGRSLLAENRAIKALKPSDQIQNRILLFIQRVFYRILHWLYPFEKTPYNGIVNALDTHSTPSEEMQADELCPYFRRFFGAEKNGVLQGCAEELQEQYRVIDKCTSADAKERAKVQAAQKKISDKVARLKEGEQSLVVYSKEAKNELFFLFSKKQGKTHLKVVGRGEALIQLSGIREAVVAGQAQIVTSIDYGVVPEATVHQLLASTPLSEPPFQLSALKALLDPLRPAANSLSDFAPEPTNNLRFLQNVFSRVEMNRGRSAEDVERMGMRLELFTLFSHLKEVRMQQAASPETLYALQRMLQICSTHLLAAYQSKIISEAERNALVPELTHVQKSLDQMVADANKRIESMNMPPLPLVELEKVEGLTAAKEVPMGPLAPRHQTNSMHGLPHASSPAQLDRKPVEKAAPLTKESLCERLKALATGHATAQQIVRALYAIPFTPFAPFLKKPKGAKPIVVPSIWSQLSKEEAVEVMQNLFTLSKKLVEFCVKEKATSPDNYEVLMKMTAMIMFLTYNHIENQNPSIPCRRLIHDVIGFIREVCKNGICAFGRFGHTLHKDNVDTNQELSEFYWNIYLLDGDCTPYKRDNARIDHLSNLQNQVELLFYLTPHHPSRHDSFGAISAMVHHWIPPMPLPLLASYHRLTLSQGGLSGSKFSKNKKNEYEWSHRDTPEAIQDDPDHTVAEFEETLKEEINKWKNDFRDERTYPSGNLDLLLDGSPYSGTQRKARIEEVLLQQDAYFKQAMQMPVSLSQKELTAVISLLRKHAPQKVIMDFITTHRALLYQPSIRAFIQLIFFDYSLLDILKRDVAYNTLHELLPSFLKEQINKTLEKIAHHPEEKPLLIFFMQMNEQLKGVYEALGKETTPFFKPDADLIRLLLANCEKNSLSSENCQVMALVLKLLFAEPHLTQEQVYQTILGMHVLKIGSAQAGSQKEFLELQESYIQLLQEIKEKGFLGKEQIDALLDKLCEQKGFARIHSSWTGTFPQFQNDRYRIDLQALTVTDLARNEQQGPLPPEILNNPLFKAHFPDLAGRADIQALSMMVEGKKVYLFDDARKRSCRIEQQDASLSFYRMFSHTGSKRLQATLLKEQTGVLPAVLHRSCFFDPDEPDKGYILSDAGDCEYEVHFKPTQNGRAIAGIIDLRLPPEKRSLQQLITGKTLNHPGLKQLEQMENREHILLWGTENGKVEKIELPRYELQFALRDGALECITPHYAGYKVRLGATLEERCGLPCSLLLECSDRKRPQKLLLPSADALHITHTTESYVYTGLARSISWLKTKLSGTPPANFLTIPHFAFKPEPSSLKLTCIDLRPHSQEMVFTQGREAEQQHALIRHAMALGQPERLLEVVRYITVEKEGTSLPSWLAFLDHCSSLNLQSPQAGALLKLAEKLRVPLKGQTKRNLLKIEEQLLLHYIKTLKTVPASFRLSQENFQAIAERIRVNTPLVYQKMVAPFFMRVGDAFTIPMLSVDGSLNPLSPVPPSIVKPKVPAGKRRSSIFQLEQDIRLDQTIDPASLQRTFASKAQSLLLFNQPTDLSRFSLDALLNKVIIPKRITLEQEKEKAKEKINQLRRFSSDPEDQLALFAHDKESVSFSELAMVLMQNDLKSLKDRLPKGLDLQELKRALIVYYNAEVQLHYVLLCEEEAKALLLAKTSLTTPLFEGKVNELKERLLYKRQYDPESNPELLIFEAFHFLTFRNGTTHQLDLLKQLLEKPANIVQAGTGSGKSSVLSVLRALMRANGSNLVTQKVLPHLYQETLTLLQTRLSGTFKRKIYPFRYTQKALLAPDGRSLFQEIYHNLLETIKNKGCVLTDYRSYVLLEQKFLALSQTLASQREAGNRLELMTVNHWYYLAKILHLLKNRNDELMDEFDQPLNAMQRIQTQITGGASVDVWMINASMHIYDLLKNIPELPLAKNLQADLSDAQRAACIATLADKLAAELQKGSATTAMIRAYLLGENDEVLKHLKDWSEEEKGLLAFYKDQCFTYLPLTLGRAAFSNYARSQDGRKIVTCAKGQKREAKFGNCIEEINYTIQHYMQQGIDSVTLSSWVRGLIKRWKGATEKVREQCEQAFAHFFRGVPLAELDAAGDDDFKDLIKGLLVTANNDPKTVRHFLKRHLLWLKTSGMVVSMNPQDSVAMSLAVSGISATAGSLGSLHSQFKRDEAAAKKVQQEMIERAGRRIYEPLPLTTYKSADPLAVLKQVKDIPAFCTLIDASGAFNALPRETVAQALLDTNPNLKRVDYYDEEGDIATFGERHAPLEQTGFYFPEAQTRGSDQLLRPDGVALMLTRKKGSMEDYLQEQGRMRHDQQKLIVALPECDPAASLDELTTFKGKHEKQKNGDNRYRSEIQRLDHFVRDAARQDLLKTPDLPRIGTLLKERDTAGIADALDPFLARFTELSPLFITSGVEQQTHAAYFAKNHPLIKCTANPLVELQTHKDILLAKCERLNLHSTPLKDYRPADAAADLPERVFPKHAMENREEEIEVEEELEQEVAQEVENEVLVEQEQQREVADPKVDSYLPRKWNDSHEEGIPAHTLLLGPFDPKIVLTDAYLPQNRTDPLHKRTPFDARTGPIQDVEVVYSYQEELNKIMIGDLIDDEYSRSHKINGSWYNSFRYNIRTGKVTDGNKDTARKLIASAEFQKLIAQIKFMDGTLDDYSDREKEQLAAWIRKNQPTVMENYFCTQILRNRTDDDRDGYQSSQLAQIFAGAS